MRVAATALGFEFRSWLLSGHTSTALARENLTRIVTKTKTGNLGGGKAT